MASLQAPNTARSAEGGEPVEEGRLVGGRFRARQRLAHSSGIATYLGVDLQGPGPVVIKTVPLTLLSPGALMRLEHEAARLRRVEGRHFPRLLDSGRDGDEFFLVLDYIPGVPLRKRLEAGPLAIQETLVVGRALFAALAEIHRHGVLHRGARPSNVIVNEHGPITTATLVDFGPARAIEPEAALRGDQLEAALYVSPEQAGSLDQDVAEPSDLYSAGAILHHALAGRPPFSGDSLGAILFAQMTASLPELRVQGVVVPRALDELIGRLLRKDPRDRYQSAQAVLADVETIAAHLAQGETDPAVVIGAQDRRCTLTEPAFVARAVELGQLDEQIGRARSGSGAMVVLEGESGGGKSRLLAEVAQRAARDGLWILRGSGTSQVAQHPFQLLDGIVEGFLSAVRADPALARGVRRRLGIYCPAVVAALPGLAELLGQEEAHSLGPEEAGEARTIQALASFLDALGTPERPALVILDDCQWADELTCRLVRRWQAQALDGVGPRHVVLVTAFRSEEVAEDHLLRRALPAVHLRLSPFAPAEVRQLVESMAGRLPEEALEVVVRLAEGSPFMASAVLRGLVECGALEVAGGSWRVEPSAMADVGSSSRAAGVLMRRLELLPPGAVRLLSTGAVLGKEFDLDMAAELAEQSPEQAFSALDEARERRLVWLRPDGARCVLVHDRVRTTLLDRLEPAARQDLHRRAAAFLRQRSPDRVSELAYHFDAAGDSRSALPYALRAAEQARAQHALEIAEQQYRIALHGAGLMDRPTHYQIVSGLGDVLLLRGRYDEAGALFESAVPLADGGLAKAQIRGKLGELAFKRGDMDQAVQDFTQSLRLLGRHVPARRLTTFALLVWEILVQLVHSWFPAVFVHRRRELPDEAERLTLRLFSNMGHGCWYCRSVVLGMWAHLRGMNLGEIYPPTRELAQSYSEHAPAMTLVPAFNRAVRYADKSLRMRRALGDLWGQGQSLVFYGVTLYAASRFTECIEKCREAVRLLERLGDYWQVHMARYQIAASLYHLGDLPGAVHEARLNYRSGTETGDEQASGIILDVWARASGGAVPENVLRRELARPRHDVQGFAQVSLAEGACLLGAGDAARAAEVFEKAARTCDATNVHNAYTLPNLAWAAAAYRVQAEQAQDLTPLRRQALLGRAERAARRALKAARLCRNDLAHALREYGIILAMQGRGHRARLLLDRSLEVAEKLGARHEYAQTLLARQRVGREMGWRAGGDSPRSSEQLLAEFHAAHDYAGAAMALGREKASLSLADRFDTLIDSGRKIASASTHAAIFEEARAAALRLLRGERCLVLAVEPTGAGAHLVRLAGEASVVVSEEVVQRALDAGRAVACAEELEEASAGSHGEFSALAVPISVRGRVAACLYVVHEHVRGLFGADEERLADFIATIAGATLENAEGFEQLQRLNETLERRVEERTAAAEARAQELAASNRELERVASELRQTEEQLRVAIDAAEAANRAKSRFLATMSHEIRTPMNGVLGMAELASRTALTPQQQSYLNIVKQSGESLLTILNDVLDFSKIEAGRMELEHIPFEPREVAVDAGQVFAMSASKKGLDVVCRVAPDVPEWIVGDPGRLRQVLVNLIGNAIKFTERGEIFVDVSVEQREPGSAELHFMVKDTGIGIPADKQDCIFEAFRQSDSSTTRRFGGTGLGLSISAQLVGLMGGRIWVESEPGQGSEFHFLARFPLAEPSEAPPPRPAVFAGVKAVVLSRRESPRRVYAELLKSWGLATAAAGNPIVALSAIRGAAKAGAPVGLVLLDVDAADPHAWSLVEALRGEPNPQSCNVVLLASPTHPDLTERCRQLGITHCLTRPPKHAELMAQVAGALGDPHVQSEQKKTATAERPLRILLAEDGPVNQEVAVGLLSLRGHEVEIANNGREALEALERSRFDVVLMDVEMPEMDGLQATTRIREREQATGRRLPVIAMTAHALKGFRERCLEAGMDGYISKPVKPDELYHAVESAASEEACV